MRSTPRRHPASPLVAWICLVLTSQSMATVVSLDVRNKAGTAAEDTIVVLDPLDAAPPPAHDTAVIDQVDKQFVPRVSVLRTGTSVTFPNSDRIRHQVYSFSTPKVFSLKLYAGSPTVDVVFDKPGLVVLGCNIHDSMVAFVGVVDSPYFVKIGKSGIAQLNAPPGHYRLRVWNAALMTAVAPRPITIAKDSLSIPLVVDADPSSADVAAWPE